MEREHLLLAAAAFLPVLFVYLGVKSAFRLGLAFRREEAGALFSRERGKFLAVGAVNLLLGSLSLYGWLIEADWVELVHKTVQLDKTVPSPSLRIVHLSDLHIDGFGRLERRALDRVRSAKPDLICLTGDYLSTRNGASYLEDARRFVRELDAPFGVYAVLGNWDTVTDLKPLFAGSRVRLLADRSEEVHIRGTRVVLTGCRFGVPPPSAFIYPSESLNILLQHSPDFLEEASAAGYDLYLAGHTHGGQLCLPWYGAIITLSKFGKRYEAGLYSMRDTFLYVSRGLGVEATFKVRLFCRPEVTVLDVEGK